MLETATNGFASFIRSLGWIVHIAALQKLRLFKVEDTKGQITYVVAPDIARTMEIYCADAPLHDGQRRMFRIVDGFFDLPPERLANIHALLELGPVGIVDFDVDAGWSLRMG